MSEMNGFGLFSASFVLRFFQIRIIERTERNLSFFGEELWSGHVIVFNDKTLLAVRCCVSETGREQRQE
jgi:hypothetical protein